MSSPSDASSEAEIDAADTGSPASTSTQPSYWPDRRVWYLVILSAVALVAARLAMSDASAFHIALVVSVAVCGTAFWLWFAFFSAYPRFLRLMFSSMIVGALVGFTTFYKIESFSGDLIPTIVRRGSPPADAVLPEIESKTGADLLSTTAEDFPQFLGPKRNSVISNLQLERNWETNPPRELWRQQIGAGWSGFAAVNGYAVTLEQRGDREFVTCYDVLTGEAQWGTPADAYHDSVLGFKGPRSTPTIHGGLVYAMGATGLLRCLNGEDGSIVWERDLFAEAGFSQEEAESAVAWGRAGSPLIVGTMVVVPVGGTSKDNSITLAALALDTGETIWESSGYQISYASPMLMTLDGVEQIVTVNENWATGHDIGTGDVLWEYPWEGLSNMNANCSQPMQVDETLVLLSKGYGKGAARIEVTNSGEEWDAELDWENNKTLRTKFSNVAIRDGFAYALDDGVLCCADLESGERQWRKGRYRYGQILLVDDLLLVLSEFGELALVEANPDKYIEVAKIEALNGQTWNNLCLYGPHLLLRNGSEAVCYELPLTD